MRSALLRRLQAVQPPVTLEALRARASLRSSRGGVMADDLLRKILKQLEVTRTIPSTAIRLRERAVDDAVEYILGDRRFDSMQVALHNIDTLQAALKQVDTTGTVAEFGVYQGRTLTAIARRFPDQTVHGFDSFEGLPEAWGGTNKPEGSFDIGGSPPKLPVKNVEFHVGHFDETVPKFAMTHSGPFSFVHLDADLYSSTKTVLDVLGDWFVAGTIVVFDEYFGYHGWQHHEHRAFTEFLERTGLSFQALGLGHMNLAVRLTAG
jgi:hypothetical protein